MDSPENTGLASQIAAALTAVLGWFFAMIFRNNKRIDDCHKETSERISALESKISNHEIEDAKYHLAQESLQSTVKIMIEPLINNISNTNQKIDAVNKKVDMLIDRELRKND